MCWVARRICTGMVTVSPAITYWDVAWVTRPNVGRAVDTVQASVYSASYTSAARSLICSLDRAPTTIIVTPAASQATICSLT